jgi:hypothetical protein
MRSSTVHLWFLEFQRMWIKRKISGGLNDCFIGNLADEKISQMTLLENEMVLYHCCIKGVDAPAN